MGFARKKLKEIIDSSNLHVIVAATIGMLSPLASHLIPAPILSAPLRDDAPLVPVL
jgi:hypothetical protein